jgi:hypothetical protein
MRRLMPVKMNFESFMVAGMVEEIRIEAGAEEGVKLKRQYQERLSPLNIDEREDLTFLEGKR